MSNPPRAGQQVLIAKKANGIWLLTLTGKQHKSSPMYLNMELIHEMLTTREGDYPPQEKTDLNLSVMSERSTMTAMMHKNPSLKWRA